MSKINDIVLKFFRLGFVLTLVCCPNLTYAVELPEEKEEEVIRRIEREIDEEEVERFRHETKARKARWSSYLKLNYAYDTNPLFSVSRGGDSSQSAVFGLNVRKTFHEKNQFLGSLTINHLNYSDFTDLSNTLGHGRLEYKRALSKKYILGAGYDLSFSYYPLNAATEFTFHKAFANFQHRFTKNLFHKVEYQYGWKRYEHALATSTLSSTAFSNEKRNDRRFGGTYTVGYTMTGRLSTTISTKYFINDSNSAFENYYDFVTLEFIPRLSYRINDSLSANASYSYKHKTYMDRNVSAAAHNRIDRISRANVGLNYKLNENHSFTTGYTYNENASNDLLSDYTGSKVEAGWRYNF